VSKKTVLTELEFIERSRIFVVISLSKGVRITFVSEWKKITLNRRISQRYKPSWKLESLFQVP